MIELNLEEEKQENFGACLKVIGIGGAGGNAVNSMINSNELKNINFIVANTDAQALNLSLAEYKIQIGKKITKGLGAGANPDVGRRAAEEDIETILEEIKKTDILFLTAGLGGGTGSGALPVIAKAAKELGILTVAIVTKPFLFEGRRRTTYTHEAIKTLKESVDTLIIVPNQKLLEIVDPKISMLDAFAMSDDVLKKAIKGISDIITKAGHINVDFADVREIMKDMGMALMGTGIAEGEERARQAALNAINSPLLEDISIKGAKGVLINITGNIDLGLQEINEAASLIHDMVSENAEIILGSVIDPEIGNQVMVTVIATGFETETKKENKLEKEKIYKTASAQKEFIKNKEKKKEEENFKNLSESSIDLDNFDTPTFLRKKAEEQLQSDKIETLNIENKENKNEHFSE
ncbi:cell division protein FtsZ [Candidatus Dependentiae bacterium]|nr:cell division protein FtsZ [Candidatus Dependentiae bacterium]